MWPYLRETNVNNVNNYPTNVNNIIFIRGPIIHIIHIRFPQKGPLAAPI